MNKDTCTWKYGNMKIQNEQELQNSHIYYNSIHFEVTLWNITTSYCQLQGTNRFETYPISYQNFIHSNKSRELYSFLNLSKERYENKSKQVK